MQRPGVIFLIVVTVAVIAVLLYLYGPFGREVGEIAEERPPTGSAPSGPSGEEPSERAEPEPELPALAGSDGLVREVVEGLSPHSGVAASLVTEDLIRRFVGAVHAIADGRSPRRHLAHLEPEGRFRVIEENGAFRIDPRSYRRYDGLAEAFGSLDVDGTAEAYERLEPLMDEAYADLGEEGARFRPTLIRALDVLLATPVPEGPLELVDRVLRFEFRDSDLEGLSEAQKHLVRTGPENVERIQATLRALRARLLELPPEGPPSG
jgi:hypothetical protein